jgi:predicted alpha/beta hydrolase
VSGDTAGVTIAPVDIRAADGVRLAGLWVLRDRPTSVVVLHGATGVARDYYKRFAVWLAAETSAAVLIYDYRDQGASLSGSLRASNATMGDWAIHDQAAALEEAFRSHPDLPVDVIGHSLGAMGLPFHEQATRVRGMTAVASGPAHWTRHPWPYRALPILFWFGLGPIATALAGYTPGRLLGLGADLPAGAFWQWRRWCTNADFHRVDWGGAMPEPDLGRFRGKLTLVAVADDPMIPPPVVRDITRFYPNAEVTERLVEPAALGLSAIGHIRVFSPANKAAWGMLKPGA